MINDMFDYMFGWIFGGQSLSSVAGFALIIFVLWLITRKN